MATYKEQMKDKQYYVLMHRDVVFATFGNLKKVCNYMAGQDFPKYNTIVRKKENPIIYKDYKLFKVNHY